MANSMIGSVRLKAAVRSVSAPFRSNSVEMKAATWSKWPAPGSMIRFASTGSPSVLMPGLVLNALPNDSRSGLQLRVPTGTAPPGRRRSGPSPTTLP